jgi:hypothetical protein
VPAAGRRPASAVARPSPECVSLGALGSSGPSFVPKHQRAGVPGPCDSEVELLQDR